VDLEALSGGAWAFLLRAGVVSRVGAIDGVDWRRGDVMEVAAALSRFASSGLPKQ